MRIINIQKHFVHKLPKGFIELEKSPIGIIDCNSNLYNLWFKISNFKKNAVQVKDTYRELVLNSGEKVIRSDYKAQNGFQLVWEKIFNKDNKLIAENFIDILDKATIEYAPSTGKMKLLKALTPRGIIKYILG